MLTLTYCLRRVNCSTLCFQKKLESFIAEIELKNEQLMRSENENKNLRGEVLRLGERVDELESQIGVET